MVQSLHTPTFSMSQIEALLLNSTVKGTVVHEFVSTVVNDQWFGSAALTATHEVGNIPSQL
jgi:hypothetical protein